MSFTVLPLTICLSFFFFLMIRRPPRSTLFPTRRSSDLDPQARSQLQQIMSGRAGVLRAGAGLRSRSEEHTSELQSRVDLVCRLLLEKKKKIQKNKIKLLKKKK